MESLAGLLLPYQKKFADSKARRKLWLSSRQAGKSFTLAYAMVRSACARPGSLSLCISTGLTAALEMMKKVERFSRAVGLLTGGTTSYSSTQTCVTFSNGSRVMCLPSGNPAGLRGWSARLVCIDEAAFIDDADEVFQSIAPTLTRDKEAELLVTSTPGGMSGWFWELYNGAGDDWYVQTTTIHDAVRDGLDVDVEELRRLCPDPDVFAQEYECRFSKESASMLDPGLLQFADEIPDRANLDFLGYDVGSTNDRSVLTDLRTADNDVYYVDSPVVMSRTSYEDQLGVLAELQEKRRFRKGYVDSNGIGSAVAEFARKKVSALIEPWHWTAQNKTAAYEALRDLVFRRKIFFPRSAERLIRDDFRNVRRVVGRSGSVSYVAGRNGDGHSDFVSSLVLAVAAALKHPAGHQTIRPAPYSGVFRPTRLF